jgi:hypothetical protein
MNNTAKVLSRKNGNWIILLNTVGNNNGLKNQTYPVCINANIDSVQLKNGTIIKADCSRVKLKSGESIYITHMWDGHSGRISVSGYYKLPKGNPYSDDNMKHHYFSPHLCSVDDIYQGDSVNAE